ncbi:hypothetical protein HBB16_07740 [Pseudonocardia sp. MCCB 268]|nr:hypothetical protein [Pseudonocardia cytotoxica]
MAAYAPLADELRASSGQYRRAGLPGRHGRHSAGIPRERCVNICPIWKSWGRHGRGSTTFGFLQPARPRLAAGSARASIPATSTKASLRGALRPRTRRSRRAGRWPAAATPAEAPERRRGRNRRRLAGSGPGHATPGIAAIFPTAWVALLRHRLQRRVLRRHKYHHGAPPLHDPDEIDRPDAVEVHR